MNSFIALVTVLGAGPAQPDNSLPGGGYPSQGLPGQGYPDNSLPGSGPGHPWFPGHRPDRPDQGLPGGGQHPGNALPMPPVKPSQPIVLPPGVWPPHLPSIPGQPDNSLPPHASNLPIVIPPDQDIGITQPIFLPPLPQGVALLIALPHAQPKAGTPPNTAPAILVQAGQRPVLVYVSAGAQPKMM